LNNVLYFQAKEAQARQIAELEQEQKLAQVMADLKHREIVEIKTKLFNILNRVNFKFKKTYCLVLFFTVSYFKTIHTNFVM